MKKVRGVQRPQKKNAGGILIGPSHEEGGVPAIVDGTTQVELEGGEYIINAQTVDALGQPFLDKLNSTETEYHTGGYEQGQLPSPSQFDEGGKVNKKNKMQEGGVVYNPGTTKRISSSKLKESNNICPPGMYRGENNACFQLTGDPASTGGGYQNPGSMRKGGKVNSPKKMAQGGVIGNKKLSNRSNKPISKRNGGEINRPTPRSMGSGGHTHKMDTDIYGDGWTTGGNHTHQVKGHEIQMNCDDGCHSH